MSYFRPLRWCLSPSDTGWNGLSLAPMALPKTDNSEERKTASVYPLAVFFVVEMGGRSKLLAGVGVDSVDGTERVDERGTSVHGHGNTEGLGDFFF